MLGMSPVSSRESQCSLKKHESFNRNFIAVGSIFRQMVAARDHLYIGREGFNDHIAALADCFESGSDGFPINMIIARCAAVTAASVEMSQRFPSFPNRLRLVLLLDIHMECVEVQLERRAAHVLNHS